MALFIRRKKQDDKQQHPEYLMGKEETWQDRHRREHGGDVTKNFYRIIGFAGIILVVLMVVITTSTIVSTVNNEKTITAVDTFSVTSKEQSAMSDSMEKFVTGMMLVAYCSDSDMALEGKSMALAQMANNTNAYEGIEKMSVSEGGIPYENIKIIIDGPEMVEGTHAYAGEYEFQAAALCADKSTPSQDGDFTVVDRGYKFDVIFELAEDENGNRDWKISDVTIKKP